jgi:hypothetical protein
MLYNPVHNAIHHYMQQKKLLIVIHRPALNAALPTKLTKIGENNTKMIPDKTGTMLFQSGSKLWDASEENREELGNIGCLCEGRMDGMHGGGFDAGHHPPSRSTKWQIALTLMWPYERPCPPKPQARGEFCDEN